MHVYIVRDRSLATHTHGMVADDRDHGHNINNMFALYRTSIVPQAKDAVGLLTLFRSCLFICVTTNALRTNIRSIERLN